MDVDFIPSTLKETAWALELGGKMVINEIGLAILDNRDLATDIITSRNSCMEGFSVRVEYAHILGSSNALQ